MFYIAVGIWVLLALIVVFNLARCFRLVPNRRAHIVERLGRYHQTWNAGFHMLLPFIDRVAYQQDLREETIDVPPQDCFTKDNVKVEVDGVLYLSVMNPVNASYGVTNYKWAAIQLAQTTTRSVIGTLELDRTFEERDAISSRVVSVLNEVSEAWGIKVHRYEVKNIVVPGSVRNSMERQMGAERDRRALLARSEGERQARINVSEASRTEAINRSEGEKQRCINEAQGRAEEILAVAQATAESIRKMGKVLSQPGGVEAVSLRLGEAYISKMSALANPGTRVLLPNDLSNMDQVLGGLGLAIPGASEPVLAVAAVKTGVVPVSMPPPGPGMRQASLGEPTTIPGMPAMDREPR
ncbi:MAG: stomatin-like protein [Pseudomonadota bacterium]